ncbi:hypothetical protein JAAARDRAFT_371572 [Jaapia argillacea MUCL 33604]|uniref:DUF7605 domain-containing protein n=1 Tax=Jaapia argillacea MUCL 33604 TaxID=933084 RepID=A0A067Q847_9AGAM|nr:hypothetical protein JAAARDRAFT_371572 [Jaapia argillacea MUCL 33604]
MLRERTAEVERQIGRFVTSHLTPQVIEARDSCKKVFNDIAKDNHWRAYAACMRRQGEHGTIDLNDDLIKHIYPKIYEEWFHVFTKRIPAILTQLIEEDLMGAIVEAIKELGKNAPPHRQDSIQRALRSVFTNEKVKGCARKIRKDISLRQRDISHSFKARIKETLKPHYKTVGKESGPGMYQRMKNANERYARESCGHLFECSVRGASSDLRGKLCDDVQVKLEKFLKRILNDICQAYLSSSNRCPLAFSSIPLIHGFLPGALKATHFHTEKKEREKIMIWVREQQTVLAQLLNELPQETLNRR